MDLPHQSSTVLASAATGVVGQIIKNGGDPESIFSTTSIQPEDLGDPINELSLHQFCHLFTEAAKQTANENFGLHFGAQFKPKHLGAIGYVALSSPTLATALRKMEIYFPAHQQLSSFGVIKEGDILWLSYRINDPGIVDRRQDAELSMGMFLNIFRQALGENWSPLEVRFEHQDPGLNKEHENIFSAPVLFGRRTNAIGFRLVDLESNMPDPDPYLYAIVENFLESRQQIHNNPEKFADAVRNQIMLNLSTTPPTLIEIARLFGVPESDFQNQLRAHQLSFKTLLRAAKEELSLHYLNNPDIPLTEIAMLLGYSELSAFSRAFRSWTGMNPQKYRRIYITSISPRTTPL
ncbi:MAG: AraC family transcriptional regulator [Nitrospinaceae bacterium]|jgi:AraC-like DNA-binding protein|nr:AraC family transcriptional regulator [Nitrospinaceae bacterium]|tara:strand:- start:1318 stop:2367 length:1050 start_codon:yes stop_codon:yes gene_type:complete